VRSFPQNDRSERVTRISAQAATPRGTVPKCQVTSTGPGTGRHPRSRRRLRLPQSSIIHDRRRTSSHHAHQKDSSHDPREINITNRANRRGLWPDGLSNFPEFLGAPGRIRTCAPASGGRLSGTSWPPLPALPSIRGPSAPAFPVGARISFHEPFHGRVPARQLAHLAGGGCADAGRPERRYTRLYERGAD
jgi:hypothetical protein